MDENRERDYNREYIRETIKEPSGIPDETEDPIKDRFAMESEEPVSGNTFVIESVKEKRSTRLPGIGKALAAGIIFGLCACMAFYALRPWAQRTFGADETVSFPEDQPEQAETEAAAVANGTSAEPGASSLEYTGTAEEQKIPEMTQEQYLQMVEDMRLRANRLNHSVVTVTGVGNQSGWFEGNYRPPRSTSGVIVARTDEHVLILALQNALEGSDSIDVEFSDASHYSGTQVRADRNTGIAVISVDQNSLSAATSNAISVAKLGNSYGLTKGEALYLLGSPFGEKNGYAYGFLSGKNGSSGIEDGSFELLVTDVAGSADSSGALMNMDGELVGLISTGASDRDTGVITALPISSVKRIIEKLGNGEGVAYLGIRGMDINAETADAQDISEGIYLTEVAMDSPAMEGGLQIGDTIISIGNTAAGTRQVFYTELLSYQPGDVVRIKIMREGKETSFKVILGEK